MLIEGVLRREVEVDDSVGNDEPEPEIESR
jgi:hypothetical protein